MIKLYAWDGIEEIDYVAKLEKLIPHSLVTSSVQAAIQIVLESAGTTVTPLPVLMPVTAPLETFSGVLRAGAQPVLLDIDAESLQMSPERLQEALTELGKGSLVLVHSPLGTSVTSALRTLIGTENVGIFDASNMLPNLSSEVDLTFEIYGFRAIAGGAVIKHPYDRTVLKQICNGICGLSARMSNIVALKTWQRLSKLTDYDYKTSEVVQTLSSLLHNSNSGIITYTPGWGMVPIVIKTDKAKQVQVHLQSYNIETEMLITPLYAYDEVARRFTEGVPDYPVTNSLRDKLLAIPTHPGVKGKEEYIVEKILEAVKV